MKSKTVKSEIGNRNSEGRFSRNQVCMKAPELIEETIGIGEKFIASVGLKLMMFYIVMEIILMMKLYDY